jgi:hypothetical protein
MPAIEASARTTGRGVEVYFDRPLGRRVTARASYSYSIADEDVVRIENVNGPDTLAYDLSHPGPQDQRHAANVDVTISRRRRPHRARQGGRDLVLDPAVAGTDLGPQILPAGAASRTGSTIPRRK